MPWPSLGRCAPVSMEPLARRQACPRCYSINVMTRHPTWFRKDLEPPFRASQARDFQFRCWTSLISRAARESISPPGTTALIWIKHLISNSMSQCPTTSLIHVNEVGPGACWLCAARCHQGTIMFTRTSGFAFFRIARGRMPAFLLASLIALFVSVSGAAAHDGWFVPVCPAKTEANRIHLSFSGDRQGFSWSWIKGRTAEEIDLPGRFRSVARITTRGSTTSTPSNIQPQAYVCVGFRDHIVQRMEFDDHEDHQKNWSDTDDCAC